MWLGARAAVIFLGVAVALQYLLPPNRGDLTVEEYCENFNFYLDMVDPDSPEILDATGRWVLRDEGWGVTYFEPLGPLYCSDLVFGTSEDGWVTWIQFSETAYTDYVYIGQSYALAAALALAGAQRDFNCFTFDAAAGRSSGRIRGISFRGSAGGFTSPSRWSGRAMTGRASFCRP